jgi:hypothetical protein
MNIVSRAVPRKGLTAPRTLQQAFGPYAEWPKDHDKMDRFIGWLSAAILICSLIAVLWGF